MTVTRAALLGFIQAAALAAYCWLVSLIFIGPQFFVKAPPAMGVVFFLLLFVFSAVVSGAIVLGYPGYLVLNGRWKEAAGLVAVTAAWLVIFLGLLALTMFGSV